MMQAHEIQVAEGFTRHPASAPPPSAAKSLTTYMRRVALAGTLPGGNFITDPRVVQSLQMILQEDIIGVDYY